MVSRLVNGSVARITSEAQRHNTTECDDRHSLAHSFIQINQTADIIGNYRKTIRITS